MYSREHDIHSRVYTLFSDHLKALNILKNPGTRALHDGLPAPCPAECARPAPSCSAAQCPRSSRRCQRWRCRCPPPTPRVLMPARQRGLAIVSRALLPSTLRHWRCAALLWTHSGSRFFHPCKVHGVCAAQQRTAHQRNSAQRPPPSAGALALELGGGGTGSQGQAPKGRCVALSCMAHAPRTRALPCACHTAFTAHTDGPCPASFIGLATCRAGVFLVSGALTRARCAGAMQLHRANTNCKI